MALVGLAAFTLAPTARGQAETVTAAFTTPDAGITTNSYSGTVLVTVSGVGQSYSSAYNDAFYVYQDTSGNPITPSNPYYNPTNPNGLRYYQLAYSANPLSGNDYNNAADLSVVGGLPAYSPSHSYTFFLNTGLTAPGKLHFGVIDGDYGDNTGAYTITLGSAPEPGIYAFLGSLALSGVFLRLRKPVR